MSRDFVGIITPMRETTRRTGGAGRSSPASCSLRPGRWLDTSLALQWWCQTSFRRKLSSSVISSDSHPSTCAKISFPKIYSCQNVLTWRKNVWTTGTMMKDIASKKTHFFPLKWGRFAGAKLWRSTWEIARVETGLSTSRTGGVCTTVVSVAVPLAGSDDSHHVQLLCVHRASSITIVTITSANTPAPASGTRLPVLQSTVEFASLVASVRMVW